MQPLHIVILSAAKDLDFETSSRPEILRFAQDDDRRCALHATTRAFAT